MTVELPRSAGFILAVAYRGAEKPRAVPVRRWDHERLEGRSPQRRHCGRAAKTGGSQPRHLSGQRSSTLLSARLKPQNQKLVILLFELLKDVSTFIQEASSVLTDCLGDPDTAPTPQARTQQSTGTEDTRLRTVQVLAREERSERRHLCLTWKDHF